MALGVSIASIWPTRTHAALTPKSGQDRKVAATRDAQGRRGLRVTNFFHDQASLLGFQLSLFLRC